MSRRSRSSVFHPSEIAYVHTMLKVCRNLFLLGMDRKKRRKLLHRRQWFYQRMEHLCSYMAIDLLGYALMDNHTHFLLRSRPDIVASWDDRTVVERWLTMCPKRRKKLKVDGVVIYEPLPPTEAEITAQMQDSNRVKELRLRLSDISWWMRLLAQVIAQKANREDGAGQTLGHFFQARFHAVRVRTKAHLLACAMYIDLNPFRAIMSDTLYGYEDTSAKKRLDLLRIALGMENDKASKAQVKRAKKLLGALGAAKREEFSDSELESLCAQLLCGSKSMSKDASRVDVEGKVEGQEVAQAKKLSAEQRAARGEFLSPILLDSLSTDPQISTLGTRCSDKGFLPISATEYFGLLQWSIENEVAKRGGPKPVEVPEVLRRLDVRAEQFLDLIREFSRCCPREAGRGDIGMQKSYDPSSLRSPWDAEVSTQSQGGDTEVIDLVGEERRRGIAYESVIGGQGISGSS
jgi:hypothetical protein